MIAAINPALDRRAEETNSDVLVRGAFDPIFPDDDAVFQHGGSFLVEINDIEVAGLVQLASGWVDGFKHLRQFIIGHGRGGIHLVLQQQLHIQRRRHEGHIFLGIELVFGERCEQFELISGEPSSHLLALQVGCAADVGFLPRKQSHAAVLKHLGDGPQRHAAVARRQHARLPGDAELCIAFADDRFRLEVQSARADGHFQTLVLVIAQIMRGVVTGKLGLGHPFELEHDLVRRRTNRRGGEQTRGEGEEGGKELD